MNTTQRLEVIEWIKILRRHFALSGNEGITRDIETNQRLLRFDPQPTPDHVLRNRPNKLAKGMTNTLYRSGHKLNADAQRLSVRGTLDRLDSFIGISKPGLCPCCQAKTGPRVLSDMGRTRLAKQRRQQTRAMNAA